MLPNPTFLVTIGIEEKADAKSVKLREEGNRHYARNEIYDAILLYNKSINFAQSTNCLALAYGNRSAAFFTAGKFLECIQNIQLARENGYPENKANLLKEREEKCIQLLKGVNLQENDTHNYFKLSYPANEKIPWIIGGLEMRTTHKYGRGIYATRDLKPGDLICIEEIRAKFTNGSSYKRCTNCSKTKMLNLLPCTKSASFMFCSIECREEFYKYAETYHRDFDGFSLLLHKMEAAFGGQQQLDNFVRTSKKRGTSMFNLDYRTASESEIQLNVYKSLLTSSYPSRTPLQSLFSVLNRYNTRTRKILDKLYAISSCCGLLYPLFNSEDINSDVKIGLRLNELNDGNIFSAFFSLVNYSCISNVGAFFFDNKILCYVVAPIKANEQLFFARMGEFFVKNQMRGVALDIQEIRCDCIACVNHLTCDDLKPEDPRRAMPQFVQPTDVKSLQEATDRLQEAFKIITKYRAPTSHENCIAQVNVMKLMHLITFKLMFPH